MLTFGNLLFLVHLLYNSNTWYLCPCGLQTHSDNASTWTILRWVDLGVYILIHEL